MDSLTPAQQRALAALKETAFDRPVTASELGVSGPALAALARKGLVKSHRSWQDDALNMPTTYSLHSKGY